MAKKRTAPDKPKAPQEPKAEDPREIEFYENLARRLDLAADAIELSRSEIAKVIGVSQPRFSNWTTGQNKPDWFAVAKFCRRFGVSADWILLGDVSGLKHSMVESLERAEEERTAAQREPEPRSP